MSDIHIGESVFAQSFLRNLTVSTNVKATFHRHLSCTRSCDLPSSDTSDGHVTSSPRRRCRRKRHFIVTFRHSRPWYPSSGTSDGMSPHPPAEGADESIVSSSPFRHSRPWYPSSGTSDGMSPHPPAEGADESIVSSSPFRHSQLWSPVLRHL